MSSIVTMIKRRGRFTAHIRWNKPGMGPHGLYSWYIAGWGGLYYPSPRDRTYLTEKSAMAAADRMLKELTEG